jgi:uncharacterized protein YndB with AHSA1/START domain
MTDGFVTFSQDFDQSPDEVFAAVLDPRSWWGEGIQGGTSEVGDEFLYEVPGVHRSLMRLAEVVPNERVVWSAVDNVITFTEDQKEWDGTEVHFDIAATDAGGSRLRFTHVGLEHDFECYDVCHKAWSFYITTSLRRLITTGAGLPNAYGEEVSAIEARMAAAG